MGTTGRRESQPPTGYIATRNENKKEIEIIYHTQSKLFTNKSPKPNGHLNNILIVKRMNVTR